MLELFGHRTWICSAVYDIIYIHFAMIIMKQRGNV